MSRYAGLFSAAGKGEQEDFSRDQQVGGERKFTLLFVDDEESVLAAMKRIFMEENYEIITVNSAEKALAVMEREPVNLILTDHRMPGMTGGELLKSVRELWPETIRIMLTGHADVNSIMGAVKDGAVYKFITKPWNDEDLRLTVSLALQQYVLLHENRRLKEITRSQQQKLKGYSGIFDENRGVMGKILLQEGVLRAEELERAFREMTPAEFISDAIVRLGIASESRILKAMQDNLKVEYIDLREAQLQAAAVKFLPRELCEKNRILPVRLDGNQLTIAMADPSDIYKYDNISVMTGLKVVPLLASSSEILSQLKLFYGERDADINAESAEVDELAPFDEIDIVIEDEDGDLNIAELINISDVPPVIRIVNAIISEAIRYRASDIHIEPKTKYTLIRYRVDGMLHSKIKVPADLHSAVVSRIKILAKMDIAERRRPQDGRITVKAGVRIVDMRVSCLPSMNGEKVVLRMLDKSAAIKSLSDLGVMPSDLKKLQLMAARPQGVIISTGPTGSGKTTMLYSILASIMDPSKNFETIEEPVEYFLEEATQVAVREKIGLTFAQVLRSTLRQDPDIILVGEMRDFETADVAFKAALTGHLVFTTLHTNSSVASITRLMDMEIKPYIIASALQGIIAQRLVRRICPACIIEVAPDPELLKSLKVQPGALGEKVSRGKGCDKCNNSGYSGRVGIFELFVMTNDYRHIISSGYRESELLQLAKTEGMRTLVEDGIEKVKARLTTLEEVLRVLGPQTGNERSCDGCERMVDPKYVFCPYCGTFRSNYCHICKLPLEDDWIKCPFCGGKKNEGSHDRTSQ